jgi:hypothetical protein
MQELLNSMIRLSTAMTIFGVQQVQAAVGTVDPAESVERVRAVIDDIAAVVSARIDPTRMPGLDGYSNPAGDVVDHAWETLNPIGIVKTGADWLDGMVKAAGQASRGR